MTPLALFGIAYLVYLPFKKKPPRETMEQFLEYVNTAYPLIKPVYAMRER